MDNRSIIRRINEIRETTCEYVVFSVEDGTAFYGKDAKGYTVFMLPSSVKNLGSMCQETKSLRFLFNVKCAFEKDGTLKNDTVHILLCKETTKERIEAFIRLTFAFTAHTDESDHLYLAKLFSALSRMFDKTGGSSEIELQGLFAEMYTICYLEENGCQIASLWQSRDKMKFDFSVSDLKRLEIKSTLKNERVHHFRHEQLQSEIYDIRVASIMLQKNDRGISLKTIVDRVRETHPCELSLLMHIDSIVSKLDEAQMEQLRYDEKYLRQNIAFFDAKKIPHFNEKTPEGVFNAEYDCCLENIEAEDLKDIVEWVHV